MTYGDAASYVVSCWPLDHFWVVNMTSKQPVWAPSDIESTNIVKFLKQVNKKHNLKLKTYDDLWEWSVHPDSLAKFWGEVCVFLRVLPAAVETGNVLLARDSSGASKVVFLPQEYGRYAFILPGLTTM